MNNVEMHTKFSIDRNGTLLKEITVGQDSFSDRAEVNIGAYDSISIRIVGVYGIQNEKVVVGDILLK